MKKLLVTCVLAIPPVVFAQTTTQGTNTPVTPPNLITVTQVVTKGESEETLPNDEGTNNPVVTGSQEYIQGDKKYYIKKNSNITILFEEKP